MSRSIINEKVIEVAYPALLTKNEKRYILFCLCDRIRLLDNFIHTKKDAHTYIYNEREDLISIVDKL